MQHLEPATYDEADKLLEKLGLPPIDREKQEARYWAEWRGPHLIGLVGLEVYDRWGLLRSLVVDPAQQGTGLGKKLLKHVFQQSAQQRLEALYLLTTTARDYFLRFGFVVEDRDKVPPAIRASSEFHSVCPASATLMVWRG